MWRKSTYSGNEDSHCVEVVGFPKSIGVRDSKNRRLAPLAFAPGEWSACLASVKAGRFGTRAEGRTVGAVGGQGV
ncbi:DUF397 domain-containing protein [Streptomyces sp. NPDC007251]|uniref:DUF397 domain-containing protein n=1 Tax=unclassified Streptomyces TaxID=2593676 RepID=UPI0033D8FF0D